MSHGPTDSKVNELLWLSSSQQKVWRDYLLAVAHVNTHLEKRLREFGLDLGAYEILVCLSEAPNRRLRMSDLAEQVHQSRSRLTHAVARMEKAGLVERATCSDDGRGVNARLTDRGFETLAAAAPAHVQSVREVFVDAIDPDDFDALGRAMSAILRTTS